MQTAAKSILSLDVGERRIGVALASGVARLASPLTTLENDTKVLNKIRQLVEAHDVGTLVVGVPRGLEGQTTEQTRRTLEFIKTLRADLEIPIYEQDEALTSRQAEDELKSHGKPYAKADIDALAATYILEDFLHSSDGREKP